MSQSNEPEVQQLLQCAPSPSPLTLGVAMCNHVFIILVTRFCADQTL